MAIDTKVYAQPMSLLLWEGRTSMMFRPGDSISIPGDRGGIRSVHAAFFNPAEESQIVRVDAIAGVDFKI